MFAKVILMAAFGAVALAGLTLVGCQATGASQATGGETQSVMCDKCKTTWVRTPQQHGKVTTYTSRKVMTCPDCKSAVANFFSTGKLEHTCTSCGGELQHCEVHN
jgi:hypothetical protein